MAKKSKAPAKKTKKAPSGNHAASSAKGVKKPPAARSASPAPGAAAAKTPAAQFPTFEDAKRAAIDSLVKTIEDAELRLTAAKRASTFLELNRVAQGPPLAGV
jgi:hypothetical protein